MIAASTPVDCFEMAFEAARLAIEHMTPVMLLSDGFIANGSEPWRFPQAKDLAPIKPPFARPVGRMVWPRSSSFPMCATSAACAWAVPGMKGWQHRIGGLEKEDRTGNVSYDPVNHEKMVRLRADKVARIADTFRPSDWTAVPMKATC